MLRTPELVSEFRKSPSRVQDKIIDYILQSSYRIGGQSSEKKYKGVRAFSSEVGVQTAPKLVDSAVQTDIDFNTLNPPNIRWVMKKRNNNEET